MKNNNKNYDKLSKEQKALYPKVLTRLDNEKDKLKMYERALAREKAARKEFYYNLRTEHAFDYEKWSQTEEAATLYFLMKIDIQIKQNQKKI